MMTCKYCGSMCIGAEGRPASGDGVYHFGCGTDRYSAAEWVRSVECKDRELEQKEKQ